MIIKSEYLSEKENKYDYALISSNIHLVGKNKSQIKKFQRMKQMK